MALVLSLKIGSDFYVGDYQFFVTSARSDTDFVVQRKDADHKTYAYSISTTQAVEILPDVFVSAGSSPQINCVSLVIDAPGAVLVLRGDNFRNPPARLKGRYEAV